MDLTSGHRDGSILVALLVESVKVPPKGTGAVLGAVPLAPIGRAFARGVVSWWSVAVRYVFLPPAYPKSCRSSLPQAAADIETCSGVRAAFFKASALQLVPPTVNCRVPVSTS